MKRALLVGIDDYQHLRPLDGCVNDVRSLLPLLEFNEDESRNFECRHMYDAAMQSKSCRLTALGKHYWSLRRQTLI